MTMTRILLQKKTHLRRLDRIRRGFPPYQHPPREISDHPRSSGAKRRLINFFNRCNLTVSSHVNSIKTTRGCRKRPPRSSRPFASYPFYFETPAWESPKECFYVAAPA